MRAKILMFLPLMIGCSGVRSERDAELAYLGLDDAVERMMDLGFAGFNAASSANIDEQTDEGDASGTMVVNGKVDQGASANKGMRLDVDLIEYSDEVEVEEDDPAEWTYDTESALSFDLQLKGIPDGTFDGTLSGTVFMEGELEGEVKLAVEITGDLEDKGGEVGRVAGSSVITGTAESDYGDYDIDVTR